MPATLHSSQKTLQFRQLQDGQLVEIVDTSAEAGHNDFSDDLGKPAQRFGHFLVLIGDQKGAVPNTGDQ